MKKAQLLFPNQLFQDVSLLEKEIPVFLVEEFLFFKQYQFHQQKLAFHRATMKFYEDFLTQKGFNVHYIDSHSAFSDIRKLIKKLEKDGFETIKIIDVCDDWLEKRILKTSFNIEILENQSFINSKEDLKCILKVKNSITKPIFINIKEFSELYW